MSEVMDRIAIECRSCAAKFRVPAASAGKRGKCPKCGEAFEVPAAGATAPPTSASAPLAPELTADGVVRFGCSGCGQAVKAPADAIGKRVKCRGCATVQAVPDPSGGAPADDDLLAGLTSGDYAEPTINLAAAPLPSVLVESKPQSGGAVFAGAAAGAVGAVGGAVGSMFQIGTFFMGCVLSALGALVGAGIWFFIAHSTGYEVGWIAWGVGALAGAGMYTGFNNVSVVAGAVAAAFASVAIVIGKYAVFYLILAPLLSAAVKNIPDATHEHLLEMQATTDLASRGMSDSDDEKYEAEYHAQMEKLRPQIMKLSDAEMHARHAELAQSIKDEIHSDIRHMFFKVMFGPKDLLFFGLAIITAGRLGMGFGK